jgi:hypothetical protein
MEEYLFIQMKPIRGFLTITDPKKKSRFVCFKDKRTAETVVDYVTSFRSNYGFWPNMDMSKPVKTIQSKVSFKQRSPYELREYLSLEAYDYDTLFNMTKRTNVSFFCVRDFTHVPSGEHQHYMNFSGQEWDGEADPVEFAQLMEYKYMVEDT